MADRTVRVNVEAGNLKETTKQAKALNKELNRIENPRSASTGSRAADAALASSGGGGGGGRTGLTRGTAANFSRGDSRDFARQAQGLGGLVHVYATFAANVFAATAAFTALSKAMEFERMQAGMVALEKTTGRALGSIAKNMVSATEGAISFTESVRYTNLSTAAGFSAEQIERLTGVAKGASSALGRDLADAMDRLVRGTAKLEPELLDELGLLTRTQKAGEAYAKSIGKTFEQLTQFEKTQAFVNAVIDEGEQKYGAIAKAVEQNPFTRLAATLDNQGKGILSFINTVMVPLANVLSTSPTLMTTAILGVVGLLVSKAIPSISQWADAQVDASNRAIEAQNRFKDKILDNQKVQYRLAQQANRFKARESIDNLKRYRDEVVQPGFEALKRQGMAGFTPRSKGYAAFRDLTPDQLKDREYMNKLINQANTAWKNNKDIVEGVARGNRNEAYERGKNLSTIERSIELRREEFRVMKDQYSAQVALEYANRNEGTVLQESAAYRARQFRGQLGGARLQANADFASTAEISGWRDAFGGLRTSWKSFNDEIEKGKARGEIGKLGSAIQRTKFIGSAAFGVLATGASTLMSVMGPLVLVGGLVFTGFQLLANATGGYRKETQLLTESLDTVSKLVESNTEKLAEYDSIVTLSSGSLSDLNKQASYASNVLQDLQSAIKKTSDAFIRSRVFGLGWTDSISEGIKRIIPGLSTLSEKYIEVINESLSQAQRVTDPTVFSSSIKILADDLSRITGKEVSTNIYEIKKAFDSLAGSPELLERAGLVYENFSRRNAEAAAKTKSDSAQIIQGIEKVAKASNSLAEVKIKNTDLKEFHSGLTDVIVGLDTQLIPGATEVATKLTELKLPDDSKFSKDLIAAVVEYNEVRKSVESSLSVSVEDILNNPNNSIFNDRYKNALASANTQLEGLQDKLAQGGTSWRFINNAQEQAENLKKSYSEGIDALEALKASTKDQDQIRAIDERILGFRSAMKVVDDTISSAITVRVGSGANAAKQILPQKDINLILSARAALISKNRQLTQEEAEAIQRALELVKQRSEEEPDSKRQLSARKTLKDIEINLEKAKLALLKEQAKALDNQLSFSKSLGVESGDYYDNLLRQKKESDLMLAQKEYESNLTSLDLEHQRTISDIQSRKLPNEQELLGLLQQKKDIDQETLLTAKANTEELVKQKAILDEIASRKAQRALIGSGLSSQATAGVGAGLISEEDAAAYKSQIKFAQDLANINDRIDAARKSSTPEMAKQLELQASLLVHQHLTNALVEKKKNLLADINKLEEASTKLLEYGASNYLKKDVINKTASVALSKLNYDYEEKLSAINKMKISDSNKELMIRQATVEKRKQELEIMEKLVNAQLNNISSSKGLADVWENIAASARIYAEKTRLPGGLTLLGPGAINAGDKGIDNALDQFQKTGKVNFTEFRDVIRNELSDTFKNAAGNELKNVFRGMFGIQAAPASGEELNTELGQLKVISAHLSVLSGLNADGTQSILDMLGNGNKTLIEASNENSNKLGTTLTTSFTGLNDILKGGFDSLGGLLSRLTGSGSSGTGSVFGSILGTVLNAYAPGLGNAFAGAMAEQRVNAAGIDSLDYSQYYAVADTIDSANGNVMTQYGPLKLEKYSRGGIATSPQLAVFGEGSTPEAYVPLPDGRRIPVDMQNSGGGAIQNNFGNISISVNVTDSGTTSNAQSTSDTAKQIGNTIKNIVTEELIKQSRPGGLLTRR